MKLSGCPSESGACVTKPPNFYILNEGFFGFSFDMYSSNLVEDFFFFPFSTSIDSLTFFSSCLAFLLSIIFCLKESLFSLFDFFFSNFTFSSLIRSSMLCSLSLKRWYSTLSDLLEFYSISYLLLFFFGGDLRLGCC